MNFKCHRKMRTTADHTGVDDGSTEVCSVAIYDRHLSMNKYVYDRSDIALGIFRK